MVIPKWSFADRLKKARAIAGVGQREFAEMIGVGAPAYAQWEAGNNKPRDLIAVAKSIEQVVDVPAWWLLDIDSDPRSGHGSDNLRPTAYEAAGYRAELPRNKAKSLGNRPFGPNPLVLPRSCISGRGG